MKKLLNVVYFLMALTLVFGIAINTMFTYSGTLLVISIFALIAEILAVAYISHRITFYSDNDTSNRIKRNRLSGLFHDSRPVTEFLNRNGYHENSCFSLWINNRIGNFGSFQTYIFQAFKIADGENRRKLCDVYPYWFVYPYKGAV